jgi:hypothetical protein
MRASFRIVGVSDGVGCWAKEDVNDAATRRRVRVGIEEGVLMVSARRIARYGEKAKQKSKGFSLESCW